MPAWNNIKRWGWVKVIYAYHHTSVYIACSHSRSRSNRRGELEPSAGHNTVGVLHFSPTDWRGGESVTYARGFVSRAFPCVHLLFNTMVQPYPFQRDAERLRRRSQVHTDNSKCKHFFFFQLTLSLLFVYFLSSELWSVTRGVCLILCIILPMCVCRMCGAPFPFFFFLFFFFSPFQPPDCHLRI